MPLKQFDVTGGQQHDSFGYVDHLHCGLLQVGPPSVPKNFTIVDDESYAIAPDGKRFGISTEPHDYDLRSDNISRMPNVRDCVYLIDADGKRIDSNWKDGLWKFHFVINSPTGRDTRDFEMQLWTFNYNPAVHGPPN